MKTQLSLEVLSSKNRNILLIKDTSNICEDIDNYLIQILVPYSSKWIDIYTVKDFLLVLNSSSLNLQKVSKEAELAPLPDGIYEIKQSYKPNIHTLQHYYHFRVTDLQFKLCNEWTKLLSKECKLSREEFSKNRDKLREIDEYLMAAIHAVENCLDKEKGKELYSFVQELLKNYSNECQC